MKRFETSYSASTELVPLFRRMLELCKVKPAETVLLHADTYTTPHYPAAFMGAAMEIGAEVYQITVPSVVPERDTGPISNAWREADLVIDLVSTLAHAYSMLNQAAFEAGTRVLRVGQPLDVLIRMFPDPVVRRRVEAGARLLDRAEVVRVTSEAGTDLVVQKKGRVTLGLYSVADEPGRWDHWPSGMVTCGPEETGADGTLVLDVNDVILSLARYVTEPVKMVLRGGKIVKFEGGAEARMLEDWFASAGDESAYHIAHLGWGCEHRANWNRLSSLAADPATQDNESFYGNMQIAFGANTALFNGKNRTRAHMDFPCRKCTIYLDGRMILERGVFLLDELK
jgi:2,5-dihydroxypyridine 5,6-dioxygenase